MSFLPSTVRRFLLRPFCSVRNGLWLSYVPSTRNSASLAEQSTSDTPPILAHSDGPVLLPVDSVTGLAPKEESQHLDPKRHMKILQRKKASVLDFDVIKAASKTPSSGFPSQTMELLYREGFSPSEMQYLLSKRAFLSAWPSKLSHMLNLLKPLAGSDASRIILMNPGILERPVEDLEAKLKMFFEYGLKPEVIVKLGKSACRIFTMNLEGLLLRLRFLEDLRLTPEERNIVLRKTPMILRTSVEPKMQSAVAFLRSKGMDDKSIATLVRQSPEVLRVPIKSNLAVKFRMLEEFGLNSRECCKALGCFRWPSPQSVRMAQSCFLSFGFTAENFCMMLRKSPAILAISEKKLKDGLHCLINVY